MRKNERGRTLCKDIHCTVETDETQKYCAAHEWVISKWLARSRELLNRAKIQAEVGR